ncbi:hypothetical protein MPTK1_4g21570 [Marchantia polymorpha subsp. ruderalis]|uniref:GOLD domain-containing protein n=2 Tax=Marchantia polymorpha TaxID=3197 RepID=A0AAF6BCC2_MARPO|nr:hypothetical protein MARPO_0090s0064 [Marchantia polymorpha]BBN09656.1 hypothetical protein Mp_4g21570 [Marchantia polymorpha subsp. ruderalis]|eukprot:PTQ33330.1 hypothetical protein MARPO_0090s0064 [Marchantia polymorpha]
MGSAAAAAGQTLRIWRGLAIFLFVALGLQWAEALTMTVIDVECVYQYVEHDHDLVSGNFVVVEKNSDWYSEADDVEMVVTGPTGGTMMTAKASGGQKFSFRAGRRGHYKFCFHNPTSAPEDISFSIHVGHIPVASDVAKDEHFNPVETKIAQLKEALESISLEQNYLRRRDVRHKKTNESTQRRLLWYTVMEYVALIAVSIAQVYLIQRLFSKRIGYNKF